MEKFTTLTGVAAPMQLVNIDTDMIIPKQFLKTIARTGLGKNLFDEMRYNLDGTEITDFVLNQPAYRHAEIIIAGDNFGCGSSREHAPWALLDFGLRAVLSSEIADIFRGNALKNGLLAVVLKESEHRYLLNHPGIELSIDIADRTIEMPDGGRFRFELDAFSRECLLQGVDQLGYLQKHLPQIEAFEAKREAMA